MYSGYLNEKIFTFLKKRLLGNGWAIGVIELLILHPIIWDKISQRWSRCIE